MKLPQIHLTKRQSRGLAALALASVGLYSTVTRVASNQMAVRETLTNVTDDKPMGPGIYFQVPGIQFTHVYDTNTQTIDFNTGSNRWFLPLESSTSDQNVLLAKVAINYKVVPDEQNLIFHRWAMRSWFGKPNGYFLLTQMLNDSGNAVLGRQTLAQTLANPEKFTSDLYQDLNLRLQVNNVPIIIESLQVSSFNTTRLRPSRIVSNNMVGQPQTIIQPAAPTIPPQ